MTEPATPHVSRRPALPLIWVVPLIALGVGGWMIFGQLKNRGPEITIKFAHGAGVEAGKTELEYKGVSVGTVKGVTLDPDLGSVAVRVRLVKTAAALARAGSQFWIVHPEVSFSGIRGLETLVTGVRINVRPGKGEPAVRFRGLDRPPAAENTEAGRAFILRGEKLGGVSPGAPVYYREVKVGVVETTRLAGDATAAVVRIRIDRHYADLVRTNTVFWNAGGIAFKLSLLGAEVKSTSLESLFAGGVSFATPDTGELGPPALDGTEFQLEPEANKDWLRWRPRIPISPVDSAPEPAGSQPKPSPGVVRTTGA